MNQNESASVKGETDLSENLLLLVREIDKVSRITGDFTLRSGRRTNEYFDKYQFEAIPMLLDRVVQELVALVPHNVDVLAGLEMGGIPVVTLLAQKVGLPTAFVRKKAKPHGTERLSEGANVYGKRVLIVEDVVTSGGQIALSASALRELGATVTSALCVIDRGEDGMENLRESGIQLISLLNRCHFAALNT